MSKLCRVLSIDGGGIRGIIPAMVLDALEQRAGRPVCELFDLIAGTSTGGILAMGLTRPQGGRPRFSAQDLVDFYVEDGPEIFSRSIFRRIRGGGYSLEERYSSEPLKRALESRLADTRLSDALTTVLVPAYDIELRDPIFFSSRDAKTRDLAMVDVALATSAAPTYFEPWKIDTPDAVIKYRAFVDGGVFANNPAMCAYVEARKLFDEADEFLIASLGTGQLTNRIPYDDARGWGLIGWAQPLLGVVFDGVSDTVDYQLDKLMDCPKEKGCYYRFQVKLDPGCDQIDDAGRDNLRSLKLAAAALIKEKEDDLVELAGHLTAVPVEA